MSADQKQHYLPQSYQRGWADATGQVHVYQWFHDKLVCKPKSTKSTGSAPGLYFSPMSPPGTENVMEDEFWRKVDQWGADGLALLRSLDPDAPAQLNKERFILFVMSLLWRNPVEVARIDAEAKSHVVSGVLSEDYATHRRPHEPDTFEEFRELLSKPGLSEYGGQVLRSFVLNEPIRTQLLSMNWQVVTVTNGDPILTSDVPLIRYKGLKDDDGLLMLPLSPTEFFVAFNSGPMDMMRRIDESILAGTFIEGMNKYVVSHRVRYVYAADDSQRDFVARHWAVSETLHDG